MTYWVRRLVYANVGVFLLTLTGVLSRQDLNALVLVPALLPVRPWTVITYQFLHAGFWHLLMNMIGLFFFGPRLENRLGSRHFILLYLASGIGGAVLSILTPGAMIVGASGAVFGVLLGFARYWPRERIYVYALIPVEARVLVVFLAGLSLVSGFGGGGQHRALRAPGRICRGVALHQAHGAPLAGPPVQAEDRGTRIQEAGKGRPRAVGGGGSRRPPRAHARGVRPGPGKGAGEGSAVAHARGACLHGAARGAGQAVGADASRPLRADDGAIFSPSVCVSPEAAPPSP